MRLYYALAGASALALLEIAVLVAIVRVPALRAWWMRHLTAMATRVLTADFNAKVGTRGAFVDDPEVTELGFATRVRARPDDGKCWMCAGTGVCKCGNCIAKGLDKCPQCGGTGKGRIVTEADMPVRVNTDGLNKCANCKGTGETGWLCTCASCDEESKRATDAGMLRGVCLHCGGTGWR
jgi:hypothetical protein